MAIGVAVLVVLAVAACSGGDATSDATSAQAAATSASAASRTASTPTIRPSPDPAPGATTAPPGRGDAAPGTASELTTTLARLLVTAEDVDFLYGNGQPPVLAGDEYYEERPTGFCKGGLDADMLAAPHVFNLLDDDAIIFFGQWVSGEPVSEATDRFAEGRQVLASCHEVGYTNSEGDDIAFKPFAVANPGLDEVDGLVVTRNADPFLSVVYARHGGVITLMYFEGTFSDWAPTQLETVIRIGFTKLLDAGRLDLPAT